MQGRLHALAEFFVFAGDHGGGQRVLGHFTSQVRPGQHADPRLRGDLFEDFAHQLEGLRLDALGQADQQLAGEQLRMGRQHRAQGAGGQGDKTQVTVVQGGQQIGHRLHRRMNLDAFEVTRIFAMNANGLRLLRVTHPLPHPMAVLGQQIGHGGTKASASQDRDRALFSHMQSVNPYSGDGGIIRGGPAAASPVNN
ncbi:hypothetical protein EMIT0324P_10716 [Pseudomonas chlororaphis]